MKETNMIGWVLFAITLIAIFVYGLNRKRRSSKRVFYSKRMNVSSINIDDKELEENELIERFKQIASLELKDRTDYKDEEFSKITLDRYETPVLTDEVNDKICNLQLIAKDIENRIVKSDHIIKHEGSYKIDYINSLNEAQYLAVTTIEGPILVIAGAGSGKTRTIVYRVAYLLEKKVPPQQILLLTFTRKAANEMLARTASLLNDLSSQKVLGGTFHSFANNILRKYAKLLNISPNFTIIDTVDSEDVIDLVRHELHFEKRNRAFPRKGRIQTIISKSRNCNKGIKDIIQKEYSGLLEFLNDIETISKAYREYKKINNIFDYDDLMEFLRDSLKTNNDFCVKVQESFRFILVDEYQDTNLMQKEIVDLIAQKYRNVMVVGDDSQSIYSFRGANFENILRFPETYTDCKFVRIEQNYRSNQDILSFTNAVIINAVMGYQKNLYSTKLAGGKPVIRKFYNQEDEAEFIVSKVLEIREKGIPLNQIAVLYRATFHSNFIQAELLKRNIPYVVFGGIRFIERRHVKDIIAYLRIILNPLDPVSWNRVLKLIPGIGDMTASKIVQHIHKLGGKIDFSNYDNRKYSSELSKLSDVLNRALKNEVSISQKIDIFKEYYAPILQSLETDYEIRLLDIGVLYALASKYDNLEQYLSDFALEPPSNQFQKDAIPRIDETEDKPLVLSTVHSAKGLEWHSVFVQHLLHGLFPSARAFDEIEELEEERRLFYVACTRAKEQLFLTMPSYVSSWDAFFTLPSRFLIEVDKDKYELLK